MRRIRVELEVFSRPADNTDARQTAFIQMDRQQLCGCEQRRQMTACNEFCRVNL